MIFKPSHSVDGNVIRTPNFTRNHGPLNGSMEYIVDGDETPLLDVRNVIKKDLHVCQNGLIWVSFETMKRESLWCQTTEHEVIHGVNRGRYGAKPWTANLYSRRKDFLCNVLHSIGGITGVCKPTFLLHFIVNV